MRVTTGKVVVEGELLGEGAVVTVLAPEDSETFELNPEAEAALLTAIVEADRGEVVRSGPTNLNNPLSGFPARSGHDTPQ